MNKIVIWVGRFSGPSIGYKIASQNSIKALETTNIPFILFDSITKSFVGAPPPSFARINIKKTSNKIVFYSETNDVSLVVICYERPDLLAQFSVEGRAKLIALTLFETNSLPFYWKEMLNHADVVWTASHFNKEVFSKALERESLQIRVVPLCIISSHYENFVKSKTPQPMKDKFQFLTIVSNFSRKDIGTLLRCYFTEFKRDENVKLVIKLREEISPQLIKQFFRNPLLPEFEIASLDGEFIEENLEKLAEVEFVYGDIPTSKILKLISDSDAYVSMDRGKGWDLPAMEAMALNIPVVTIDWSGSQEFCKQDNSFLIPVVDMTFVDSSLFVNDKLYIGQQWPEIIDTDVQNALRECFSDEKQRVEKAKRGKEFVLTNFTEVEVGKILSKEINRVVEELEEVKPKTISNISNTHVTHERNFTSVIKGITGPYVIYGTGGFVHELVNVIQSSSLPLPIFIIDKNPNCSNILGIDVHDINSIELESDFFIVLGSKIYANVMKSKILEVHTHIKEDAFIDFNQVKEYENSLYRIEYIKSSDFLYLEGQHSKLVNKIDIFIDDQFEGLATLNFQNFQKGGNSGWQFEMITHTFESKTIEIKIVFYNDNKILDEIVQQISLEDTFILCFDSKCNSHLSAKNQYAKDIIFIEYPNIYGMEQKTILNRKMMESISKYLSIFNYQLIFVNFTCHADENKSMLSIEQLNLPEIDVDEKIIADIDSLALYDSVRTCLTEMSEKQSMLSFYDNNKKFVSETDSYKTLKTRTAQFINLVKKYKPKMILTLGEFNMRTPLLRTVAKTHGIPSAIYHEGFLPETWQIDKGGEFSRSFPCRANEKFQALKLTQADLSRVDKILEFYLSSNSRNKQSEIHIELQEKLTSIKNSGKKIIFLAGGNDWLSGLHPKWISNGESSFTDFIDSNDVLNELIRIAKKNNWHIIYKPHPHYKPSEQLMAIVQRHDFNDLTITYTGNTLKLIDYSDLVLTLVSSAAYEAMARVISVVLLSEHPMSHKEIAYECQNTAQLEEVIIEALNKEDWESRLQNWREFIARMSKYYLFPCTSNMENIMNKSIDSAGRFLLKQLIK